MDSCEYCSGMSSVQRWVIVSNVIVVYHFFGFVVDEESSVALQTKRPVGFGFILNLIFTS